MAVSNATPQQWQQAIRETIDELQKAYVLAHALERGKGAPVGVDPDDERYQFPLAEKQIEDVGRDMFIAINRAFDKIRDTKAL